MVGRKTGSQTSLRESNRASILQAIYKFGAMTQVELAEITGLSTATISTLVHELSDEGQVETENTVRNGRRATLVTLSRNQGIGIGVCITRRDLDVVILDFSKKLLAEHHLPLPISHRPDTTIERAQVLISESLENIGADMSEVAAIGVAVGAPIDARTGLVALPGYMPGWEDTDIVKTFEDVFKVPVIVDNDANLGGVCEERIGKAHGSDNFVYINASDGVGSGIIINGEPWRGTTGLAGEIGHIQVDPLGNICLCGNRGCLNTVIDERRLVSQLQITHGDLTLDDMVRLAQEGDVACRRVIGDAAVRIANVCASLCISVDPELVVLGGKLSEAGDAFIDSFRESLQRMLIPNVLAPITVTEAAFPETCPALGAAMMAIEHVGVNQS